MIRHAILGFCILVSPSALAQEVSVESGQRIALIGGCHDCHTDGYAASEGRLDPARAMKGSPVGFQGPWGTTYPTNLRIVAARMTEGEFVEYARTLKTRPPMPWFNLHAFRDDELRSLHRYVVSLGEPGDPAPEFVPPGEKPQTPFIVFAPPQMP